MYVTDSRNRPLYFAITPKHLVDDLAHLKRLGRRWRRRGLAAGVGRRVFVRVLAQRLEDLARAGPRLEVGDVQHREHKLIDASVETVDRHGEVRRRQPAEYRIAYRHVESPADGEWFLAARFVFTAGSSEEATRALLERRRQTQPIGEWSCGSVFTNPPADHAARLIEAAGLKGLRVGDASVSEKHANFIINHGAARAADLESLIEQVRDGVERAHGVRLTPEVRIVGEKS